MIFVLIKTLARKSQENPNVDIPVASPSPDDESQPVTKGAFTKSVEDHGLIFPDTSSSLDDRSQLAKKGSPSKSEADQNLVIPRKLSSSQGRKDSKDKIFVRKSHDQNSDFSGGSTKDKSQLGTMSHN